MSYANNKGADRPAYPRSLISAFIVRNLDRIISLDSIAEISRLVSFCGCAGQYVSGLVGNFGRHVLSCLGLCTLIVLVNHFGQLSLPRNSASRLNGHDRKDRNSVDSLGCKTLSQFNHAMTGSGI